LGDALAQIAVGVEDRVEDLADGRAGDLHLALAVGRGAELGRDLHGDWHQAATSCDSNSLSKLSRSGSISCIRKVSRVASKVFSPSPVRYTTTRSPAAISPRSASLRKTPTVTPPAVSVKIPVVSASRRIPSRISSSSTASIVPSVLRACSSA